MSGFARPSDVSRSVQRARAPYPIPPWRSRRAERRRSAALAAVTRATRFTQLFNIHSRARARSPIRERARRPASRVASFHTRNPSFHAAQEPVQGRHLRRGLEKKAGGDDDPDPQVQEGGANE